MRVATYTQPTAATRGSIAALGILVLTILLGTGVVPTIAVFSGGPLEKVLTPAWLMLYACSFLGLMFKHGMNWVSWLVRYRILLVFLILGAVFSVSWSIDAQVSAERVVHLFGSTLIAVYIGFTVPLLTTLRVFAVVLAICLIASIGAVVGLPALGIENYEGAQVWRGVFNSKNDLGFWAAIGVLLYVTLSDSTESGGWKLMCFLLASVSLALLGLSNSATSLLAMLVAGALSLYLFIANRFQLSFIRMAVMAVLFSAVVMLAIANIDTAELVGRTDDLTGRGEVWRQTWKLILERPLTGVGYGSLWYPTDATLWIQQSLTDFTWVVYHAHNGLLQVASEVGIPLALVALLMVAQQLIEIFYCQYERQQVGVLFVLAFVTAYLISNFSEARFLVNRELFWIFFLALPVSMLRQINLVSDDVLAPDDESYLTPPSQNQTTPAYSAVPGKPWLGPMLGGSVAASEVTAEAELVSNFPDLPQTNEKTVAKVTLWDEHADTTDDDFAVAQEDIIDLQSAMAHDDLLYNDTLEIDRYDIELETTDEWVDIPLVEEDR
ncbi:MAG: O-antigen ligase family protein [Granulosicoccus sp.]